MKMLSTPTASTLEAEVMVAVKKSYQEWDDLKDDQCCWDPDEAEDSDGGKDG